MPSLSEGNRGPMSLFHMLCQREASHSRPTSFMPLFSQALVSLPGEPFDLRGPLAAPLHTCQHTTCAALPLECPLTSPSRNELSFFCDCGPTGLILNTSDNWNKWATTHCNDTATGKQSHISPGAVDTPTGQLPRAGELIMIRHVSPLNTSVQGSLKNSRRAAAARGLPLPRLPTPEP